MEAKQAKKVRAAFDFETWGWTPEEGETHVVVNALCCALAIPEEGEDGQEEIRPYFIVDKTHVPKTQKAKGAQETVEKVLRFMWKREDVDEWWAHFAHNFDTLQLVAAAYRMGWRVKGALAGQGVVGVDISPPGESRWIVIRDLFRLIPSKLKKIAKDFGLRSQKLFEETDYKGDMRDLPLQRLREGCVVDCLLVLEALEVVEGLLTQFGGKLRSTSSSSALTVLLASLKESKVQLPKMRHSRTCPAYKKSGSCRCYFAANVLARGGYYGARVEVFHHAPTSLLSEYDIASSYPWSMSQMLPLHWTGTLSGKAARAAYEKETHGIYHAKVTVPRSLEIPPLPYKHEDGGLFFPTGEWEAQFPLPELRYAEGLGVKVSVKSVVSFDSGTPFQNYVANLYELKKTAEDGALREFVKLLLNGSYGKFAERPEREKLLFIPDALEAAHIQWTEENVRPIAPDIDSRILAQTVYRYSPNAHYAIGSYITAYSRMRIHEFMARSYGLAYTDTDSIHCEKWEGPTGKDLGQLSFKQSGFLGRYYAPKLYSLHDADGAYLIDPKSGKAKVACKGFLKAGPKEFEEILESARTFHLLVGEGFPKVAAKEVAKDVGQKLVRTRLLRTQLKPGEQHDVVLRTRVTKSWSGLSKKRRPYPDGTTSPWSVSELVGGEHLTVLCPILEGAAP